MQSSQTQIATNFKRKTDMRNYNAIKTAGKPGSRGFTLIELLVALTLMALAPG